MKELIIICTWLKKTLCYKKVNMQRETCIIYLQLFYILLLFGLVNTFLAISFDNKKFYKKINNPIPEWITKRIQEDLSYFHKGIKKELIKKTFDESQMQALVEFEIINNQVQIKRTKQLALSELKSRLNIITNFLKDLCKLIKIPNVNFIVNLGDGGNAQNTNTFKVPIFVFSKDRSKSLQTILMPDSEVISSKFKSYDFPYDKKIDKAIWRGSTTGGAYSINNYEFHPRYKLVKLAAQFPDLIDAKFNNLVFIDNEVKDKFHKLNYVSKSLSIADHLKYKYQILVDGNTTSWSRAYWQLFSNSIIFKHNSDNIQWYYDCLVPYVHYIPVKNDFSDLIEKINWAKKNDDQVKKIIKNANYFANNNLKKEDLFYYMYITLSKYSKLL